MKKYTILLVTLLIICGIPMFFTDDKREKQTTKDISIWFPQGYELLMKKDINDIEIIQELEKRLGFSLYYESVSGNMDDLFYAKLADMEDIDLMYYRFDHSLLTSGIQNGQFLNYKEDLDQMPNLQKQFTLHPELYQAACPNDVCALFPATIENSYQDLVLAYRSDWAQAAGYTSIRSLDELQAMLSKERALFDEGKLAQQGEYFVGLSSYNGYINELMQLFETSDGLYQQEGVVQYGPSTPQYRAYLTYMKTLFEKKLLDPSVYESDETNMEKYYLNSQSSVLLTTNAHIEKLQSYAKANGDELPLQVMSLTALYPENHAIYQQEDRSYQVLSYGYVINQGIAEDKKQKALTYLDYLYSDEGQKLYNYGIKDTHYETINQEDRYVESLAKEHDYYPVSMAAYIKQDLLRTDKLADLAMQPDWLKQQIKDHPYQVDHTMPEVASYVPNKQQELLLDMEVSLTTYVQETSSNFIFKSIDPRDGAQWQDFLAGLEQLGLNDYLQIKQTAYEASERERYE